MLKSKDLRLKPSFNAFSILVFSCFHSSHQLRAGDVTVSSYHNACCKTMAESYTQDGETARQIAQHIPYYSFKVSKLAKSGLQNEGHFDVHRASIASMTSKEC